VVISHEVHVQFHGKVFQGLPPVPFGLDLLGRIKTCASAVDLIVVNPAVECARFQLGICAGLFLGASIAAALPAE